MSLKEGTTAVLVIQIIDDEAFYMLHRASRIIVTVKSKRAAFTFEGPEVVVYEDTVAIALSQGQTLSLGVGDISAEVTCAFPGGAVLKTKTLKADIKKAVRRQTT